MIVTQTEVIALIGPVVAALVVVGVVLAKIHGRVSTLEERTKKGPPP